ncbi:hypothetical protein [Scytonema sp. NUACC26]|uniref:hypothetical protein n=1 Tax=Scytonema sp. NUACC26 TaxID=3140176 RepID=UPI0034DC2DB2
MYTPIYCTKEGIARRLRGKLNVQTNPIAAPPYSQTIPSIKVDDELTDQLIYEKEQFLNLILTQLYEMPLIYGHPILAEIVECLVVSELIKIHYTGSGMSQMGGDVSGAGVDMRQHAYAMLQMLTHGINIMIPGQPPAQMIPGVTQPQPIFLPGETVRLNYQMNDLVTNSATYIERRNNSAAQSVKRVIDFGWL